MTIERPFVHLTTALILGIASGYYIETPDVIFLPAVVVFLITLPLLNNDLNTGTSVDKVNGSFYVFIERFRKVLVHLKERSWLVLIILYTSLFLIGIHAINLYLHPKITANHIIHFADKKTVIMEGVIAETPQVGPDKSDLIIDAVKIISDNRSYPAEGRALIAVKGECSFQYGDYVKLTVRLKTPTNFQNPGAFDYKKYLLYRRILVRGFINRPERIVILHQDQGNRFKSFIEKYRRHIKNIIYEHASSPKKEIIQAMILGNQKEIPPDIVEIFNRTGVSHIIAISGFNVGIIAAFSLFVIRFFMKTWEVFLLKYNMITLSTLLSILPVVLFCFIAGMGISVVRATIMAVVFMWAIFIGRQRDLYNTLAFAAFLILIVSPYSLFDVSFQLSFMAVLAILFITPRLTSLVSSVWIEEKRSKYPLSMRLLTYFGIFFTVTVSATLGTLPLILFYFNRLSLISLPANLIVVPILGILAIPISMTIILTAPISTSFTIPFVKTSSYLVDLSIKIVNFFNSLPGTSLLVSTPSIPEVVAYYFLLFSIIVLIGRKEYTPPINRLFLYSGLCFCATVFLLIYNVYFNSRVRECSDFTMTVIDVGQGSSSIFTLPGGKTVLVDGGGFPEGSFDVGKNVLSPFLLKKRIKRIDYLVLTHPHPDHLGGLIYILENFTVGEVWTNGQRYNSALYDNFLRITRNRHIIHRVLSEQTGMFTIGLITFEVLNPQFPFDQRSDASEKYVTVNDNSLSLKMSYGKTTFLVTGDISLKTEQRLAAMTQNIQSDVLIVPHHGGRSSSNMIFLRQIQPRVAVVSCGKNNVYKMPHPAVLQRFSDIGTSVLRTDVDGAVTIKSDGNHLAINTFSASGLH